MEENRGHDQKYLKSLLHTRINQQKMLNNTLCEMVSRNSDSKAIDMLKEEINEIMLEMDNINRDLERLNSTKEEEVTYTVYDETQEVNKKQDKSFFDSIVKQTKACQYVESEAKKENKPVPKYNYDNIYKCQEKKKNGEYISIKKNLDDLRNASDCFLRSNRFLVDLKNSLGIPEYMVKSVMFNVDYNSLSISIYDFIADIGDKKTPILEVLTQCAPKAFDFTIKHLECDGDVQYVEHYTGCNIIRIFRDKLDYGSDDFSSIEIFISYHDVSYETSK